MVASARFTSSTPLLPLYHPWHAALMDSRIYLDYNATAPLAAEVREAMLPWLASVPTNPGAVHQSGQAARAAVEAARAEVAAFCGGADVIFTSGGTEADNLAVTGLLGWPPTGHLVVSAVEHPAILEPASAMAQLGVEVTAVEVDAEGRVNPDAVIAAVRPDTRLISVMAANNETGTLQPIAKIAARAAEHGVPVHCDAVQVAAWFDLDRHLGDAAMATLAGHKIGGPAGVGALVLRRPLQLQPTLHGGGQQQGRRPGTEPTALLVGMGAACRRAGERHAHEADRVAALATEILGKLQAATRDLLVTVPTAPRLPNTVHVCLADCPADLLVARLDLDGVAVSAGSACASGVSHGSYVLAALGVPDEYRDGAIRISLGYETTAEEIDRAATLIPAAIEAVRSATPAGAPGP